MRSETVISLMSPTVWNLIALFKADFSTYQNTPIIHVKDQTHGAILGRAIKHIRDI